jgi:hypothetical protein
LRDRDLHPGDEIAQERPGGKTDDETGGLGFAAAAAAVWIVLGTAVKQY